MLRVDYSLLYRHIAHEVFIELIDMVSQQGLVYQLLSAFSVYSAESEVFPY